MLPPINTLLNDLVMLDRNQLHIDSKILELRGELGKLENTSREIQLQKRKIHSLLDEHQKPEKEPEPEPEKEPEPEPEPEPEKEPEPEPEPEPEKETNFKKE